MTSSTRVGEPTRASTRIRARTALALTFLIGASPLVHGADDARIAEDARTTDDLKQTVASLDDGDGKSQGLGFSNSAVVEAGTSATKGTISFVDYAGGASGTD